VPPEDEERERRLLLHLPLRKLREWGDRND